METVKCFRFAIVPASEQYKSWAFKLCQRQEPWVVQVSRHDYALLRAGTFENLAIGSPSQPHFGRMKSIVTLPS